MISAGDQVFAISEDDDTVIVSGLDEIPLDESAVQKSRKNIKASPEKALILGWNKWGAVIARDWILMFQRVRSWPLWRRSRRRLHTK